MKSLAGKSESADYQLTQLKGGHSGADLYRIDVAGQKYLLKVFPKGFERKRLEQIALICDIYQENNINSLRMYQAGQMSDTGRLFCIYNYIDGDNFEELGENYSAQENYQVGKQIGEWLQRLKQVVPPMEITVNRKELDKLAQGILADFREMLQNEGCRELFLKYYSPEVLARMEQDFAKLTQIFKSQTPRLIHGDIKRSNVMIDTAGQIQLVDIESMKVSYDMLNFRHQMTWFLSASSLKKLEFLRGVFDGLYNNMRPADFRQQILYITLFNFFEYSAHHQDDLAALQEYFQRMQPVFNRLFAEGVNI